MTTSDVYTNWPLGIVSSLLIESGIYNDNPLLNFITNIFKTFGSIKRKLVVASVDVNTGAYVTFDESMAFTKLPTYVVASASIPFIFPTRSDGTHVLMDGGTVWNTNLVSAFDRCMELVNDPSKIILDIIILDTARMSNAANVTNGIDNYMRYNDIKSYYSSMNDILEFKKSKPTV